MYMISFNKLKFSCLFELGFKVIVNQGRIQDDFWVGVCVWGGGGGGGRAGGVDLIKLPYLLYVFGQTAFSKQCRPWSDAAECSVWSGSTLFATHSEILHTLIDSKMGVEEV